MYDAILLFHFNHPISPLSSHSTWTTSSSSGTTMPEPLMPDELFKKLVVRAAVEI